MTINDPFSPLYGPNLKNLDPSEIEWEITKIGLIDRITQLAKCMLFISATCGLALLIYHSRQSIMRWYEEFLTGERIVKILKSPEADPEGDPEDDLNFTSSKKNLIDSPIPSPNDLNSDIPLYLSTADKVKEMVVTKERSPLLSPAVIKFLDTTMSDLKSQKISDLESGLYSALGEAENITVPEDRTTLLTVAEKVAQVYVNSNFEKAMKIRLGATNKVQHHFTNLGAKISQVNPKLGVRLQAFGTRQFKQQAMCIQKQKLFGGKTQVRLDAKLTKPTRLELETTINQIKKNPKAFSKVLPPNFCTDVTVTKENINYNIKSDAGGKKWAGDYGFKKVNITGNWWGTNHAPFNHVIHFAGVGKVTVGLDPLCHAEYDHFSIEFDPKVKDDQIADKLQILFSVLGLGACSSISRTEDIERIKVMQLFRGFSPGKSYTFDQTIETFEESIPSLKNRIIAADPKMKEKFNQYLPLMYQQEVFPGNKEEHEGQFVWCIKGLADEAAKLGAVGLLCTSSALNSVNDIMPILENGMLSSQDRFTVGIDATGWSSNADIHSGGGDSVFTRIACQSYLNTNWAKAGIVFDLSLVERVGYCYGGDNYGSKKSNTYPTRPDIISLAKTVESWKSPGANEVLVRNRIPPQFFKRVFVPESEKNNIIAAMKKAKITSEVKGLHYFNGIPVEEFVQSSNNVLKKEYFA